MLRTDHGNGALGTALYLARKHSDKTLRELGRLADGMRYSAVTMAIRPLAKRLETDKALARKVKRVEKILFVKT
jgi:chromosomal replication initiation ATPase DnaA